MSERKIYPPKWILRFIKWFCPRHLHEEIEGDLLQKFNLNAKTFGENKAKRRLMTDVIRFAVPLIYLAANEWLSTYPVRIGISLSFFLIPMVVVLSMVAITSSFQMIKAAHSNPVDNLTHE